MNRSEDENRLALEEIHRQIEADTIALKKEVLADVPMVTGSPTLVQWRKENRILAVRHEGRDFYPAFQFDGSGQPWPVMPELLAILKSDVERTDWDNAVWFVAGTGWLSGQTPAECMHSRPDAVRLAAEQEVASDDY